MKPAHDSACNGRRPSADLSTPSCIPWHNISSPVGTMAGVHLCAATPNLLALEWHAASVPFFDKIIRGADGPMIRNGRITVPDAPGLGLEVDEDVLYTYRKPGEGFFE